MSDGGLPLKREHIFGFRKKTRQRVAEILGIKTKEDCKRVREEIKRKG